MTIQSRIILIIVFITAASCNRARDVQISKQYVKTNPPKFLDAYWKHLNAANDCKVELRHNFLFATKYEPEDECYLEMKSGELVGIDLGEFGGELKYIPDDHSKKEMTIKRGNIRFIFRYKNNIYFLEGLAHLGSSYGKLSRLDTTNENFHCVEILNFGDAPGAMAIYKNRLLIVADSNFYEIKEMKKEVLLNNMFWNGLYPNSIIVIDEKNVFVGIRGGIVKVNMRDKEYEFYRCTVN